MTLGTTLDALYTTIQQRRTAGDASSSYVAKLSAKGRHKIAQKLGEEATEMVIEATADNKENAVKESADLLFHLMLLWADMGIQPGDIAAELQRREGTSGIAEKASRND